MGDFIVQASERRASRRMVRLGCEVVRTRDWSLIGKRAIDLSTDGLQVLADDEATLGEDVQVFFRVPFTPLWVLAEGRVARISNGRRRRDEGPAYGIELRDLRDDVIVALRRASHRFPPTLPTRARRVDFAATVWEIARS